MVGAHHMHGVIEQRMSHGVAQDATLWKQHDKGFHHALISACGSKELLNAHSAVFDRYLRYQIIAVIFPGAPAAAEHFALRACRS